jgi:site-specific recombinase XerD
MRITKRPTNAAAFWKPVLKKAKIYRFSWHCLRHTFASRLVMAGVALRTRPGINGSQSISMTMRYSHLAPKHTLAAVGLLAGGSAAEPTSTNTSSGPTGQKQEEVVHVH